MLRKQIVWSRPPEKIQLRGRISTPSRSVAPVPTVSEPEVATAATNQLKPLLEAILAALEEAEARRRQSLGELQQVAIELAVAAASHLVCRAIEREDYAVENLVADAVSRFNLDDSLAIVLHPADLELFKKRTAGQSLPWDKKHVTLRPDPGVARGGCYVEASEGRMLVSDISSRLSELRRHWMEELDDAQIERRGAQGNGQTLRRFPDRRETA